MPFNHCRQCGRLFHFLDPIVRVESASSWPNDTDSQCPDCRRLSRDRESAEEEFRNLYLLSGIATGNVKPSEIKALEDLFGYRFPSAYRAYLRVCGSHPPEGVTGSDCTTNHLRMINDAASGVIEEHKVTSLFPKAFFVFLMRQGYPFLYFPLEDPADPPVYSYLQGDAESKRVSSRFSDWATNLAPSIG
ncbi:MAG: SMI1/KNR4 family protein [Planctomycetota bacterium]